MAGSGIVEVYSKRAAKYDITANLYYLIGVRVDGYRKRTVEALKLQPGQRVLDLACGTGANFPWLEQAVGPRGQIFGLDFTPDMLSEARKGTEKNGWANVGLVQDDAAHFNFPAPLDGVICTYAISLIPNFADVIQKAATALKYGGRNGNSGCPPHKRHKSLSKCRCRFPHEAVWQQRGGPSAQAMGRDAKVPFERTIYRTLPWIPLYARSARSLIERRPNEVRFGIMVRDNMSRISGMDHGHSSDSVPKEH